MKQHEPSQGDVQVKRPTVAEFAAKCPAQADQNRGSPHFSIWFAGHFLCVSEPFAKASMMQSAQNTDDCPPDSTLKNFDALPNSAHVRQPVVEGLFAISGPTVWRWVKKGRLPQPRKLSDRVTAWNVGELRSNLATGSAK